MKGSREHSCISGARFEPRFGYYISDYPNKIVWYSEMPLSDLILDRAPKVTGKKEKVRKSKIPEIMREREREKFQTQWRKLIPRWVSNKFKT